MLELVLLIDDFVNVILTVEFFPELSDLFFMLLYSDLLLLELLFEMLKLLVFFDWVCGGIFIFLAFALFL